MKKKGKKYVLRESELKEIILETLLMEKYDPSDYTDMYVDPKNADPNKPTPNLGDHWNNIKGFFHGIGDATRAGLENTEWGRKLQDKAYNDNNFLQWLLTSLGLQRAGSAAADWVPNFGQWGGKTQNGDAHDVLNVAAAVDWIKANAQPYYIKEKCGHCARNVREALNRGGLHLPYGMPAGSAKHYLNVLPVNGWYPITESQAGQAGDVVVVDAYRGHPDGHIAMCVGDNMWVSDYVQGRSMLGLRQPPPVGGYRIFRYKNIG